MPDLVTISHSSSAQGCQARSFWSEQDRSRGSGHVRTALLNAGQVHQVSSIWLGQYILALVRLVRSGYVSSD